MIFKKNLFTQSNRSLPHPLQLLPPQSLRVRLIPWILCGVFPFSLQMLIAQRKPMLTEAGDLIFSATI